MVLVVGVNIRNVVVVVEVNHKKCGCGGGETIVIQWWLKTLEM